MISISVNALTNTFFVAIRLSTLILLSPIEAIRLLPIHVRLLLMLILSILVASNVTGRQENPQELSLILSGIAEFCNGLMLSLSLFATFSIFHIAGQLIDTQMGINSLAILNPSDHSHDPLSSRLLIMLAVLFFFATEGHHQLIQGLIMSFHMIAPGQHALFNGFNSLIKFCSLMFCLSFMIASPILFGLLIIEITGGVVTRNMPQVSTYFLTLPLKILMGFFIFSLLLAYVNPLMKQAFYFCFQNLSGRIL